MPETGTFLSVDAVESEPPYQYVGGNPTNRADPSGHFAQECEEPPFDGFVEGFQIRVGGWLKYGLDLLGGNSWQDVYFSVFTGAEWVWDFEHKEMALFTYEGEVFEPFNAGSLSVTFYDGTIDGFKNFPNKKVLGYNGPFVGVGNSWGAVFIAGGGMSESYGYPADDYVEIEKSILDAAKVNIYPEKMTASYKGFYLSGGIQGDIGVPLPSVPKLPGWLSLGFETSTSNYTSATPPIKASASEMAKWISSGQDFAYPVWWLNGKRYSWFPLRYSQNRNKALHALKTYFKD
jgi:hypothetical protein